MGKIIQLDDTLSNKIAAGEVVERPASVVKELVENAIDAESTVIEIDVEEAGLESIRIVDNGTGIEPDDVLKAFSRHATSKIKDETDLFRIRTLGFRGEALPSIASVSELSLTTGTGEGPGTEIVLSGGIVQKHEPAASRKGTDIKVSGLFFNTPARLKYMKTIHTELGNITDVVNRLALAHPEVAMRLRHNGRALLQTTGNGDVRQVLAAIYGLNTAKKMVPLAASSLDFQVEGWISLPEVTRASRNYLSVMVNGRFIKNYSLAKAIQEGYHTLLPIGRYPIAFVNITMDPILVDVNVHPAKLEVRFSKEQELQEVVTRAIREAFQKETLIPEAAPAVKPAQPSSRQQEFSFDDSQRQAIKEDRPAPAFSSASVTRRESLPPVSQRKELYTRELDEAAGEQPDEYVPMEMKETAEAFTEAVFTPQAASSADAAEADDGYGQETGIEEQESRLPPLYPIGQMHGTYIFAQNEKGLYMIDQHAAQERLKYEFFREKVGQVEKELQDMLVPITLEYSADDCIKISEHLEDLKSVGVFLEPFGERAFIVHSHPQWLPKGEEQQMIEGIIEQMLSMRKVDIKKLREEAAIMMSCKASIKANHHLRNDEIQQLLDDLRRCSDPFTCPHGRPIVVHYSTYQIEKMFKRIM
ncbi:DNA mismatch repair endonuclease MutL [Pseudobacillus badius]|uniref:DNA mismatch repair endonuclease MutL n=1 Tax=Bacillus badius TaxID=1455 RepID=UPI0007B063D9|nr:DNA mismatch repair endonuclease MutL [Bacillus badius]KZO01744.1 DNA mismatch repair protein MutL [Bacillus badius]OCS90137.1 DNA mismatch repair protein MutL [Bacillus badius]OVE53665.1 DNA mismatch repair protein MutL [Bacillus badius]TDW06036.1 DNA mismatch repair protein MutL [Bacillus badius]